jgi:hypothetical protein
MRLPQLSVLLLCISVGCPLGLRAQTLPPDNDFGRSTLDLSRDLVRLGIASQNLVPDDPNLDARPLFQAALSYIGKHHTLLVTLDHGSYYFLTPQNTQSYLVFLELTEVRVDLAGSKSILLTRFCRALSYQIASALRLQTSRRTS